MSIIIAARLSRVAARGEFADRSQQLRRLVLKSRRGIFPLPAAAVLLLFLLIAVATISSHCQTLLLLFIQCEPLLVLNHAPKVLKRVLSHLGDLISH